MTGIMQTFSYILLYLAHGFCVSRKGGTGEVGGAIHWVLYTSRLGCKRAMVVNALNTLNFLVEIKRE